MKRVYYGLVLLLFCMAQSAAAGALPKTQAQYVKIFWRGFHVASLIAGWEHNKAGEVEIRAAIRSYGLAQAISKYRSDSYSIMRNKKPKLFKTSFSHHKGAREIRLKYNQQFKLTDRLNEPPDKPGKRTPVSQAQKNNAYDPLTAFFAVRTKMMAGQKKFTLPMYDGRRRSQLQFEVVGKRKNGDILLRMREVFLAGYTGREQRERAKRNINIDIYVNPETYLITGGYGKSPLGSARGELAMNCETFKECLKAAD